MGKKAYHHHVSPRQKVHTPSHTNQTQKTKYFYKLLHGQLLRGQLDASLLQAQSVQYTVEPCITKGQGTGNYVRKNEVSLCRGSTVLYHCCWLL